MQDIGNLDWVPCQNLGYLVGRQLKRKAAQERHNRFSKRIEVDESNIDISQVCMHMHVNGKIKVDVHVVIGKQHIF